MMSKGYRNVSKHLHIAYAYFYSYKLAATVIVYETAAVLIYEYNKTDVRIPCLSKSFFGFKCFGCGLSQAFGCLTRLQFSEAYAANPLIYPTLLMGGFYLMNHFNNFAKTEALKPQLYHP